MHKLTARDHGIVSCHYCGKVCLMPHLEPNQTAYCQRCKSHVSFRIENSVSKTWSLLVTSIIVLVPANIYPVMSVILFGRESTDTIISGIIHLIQSGQFPIAFLIFFASIVVPLFKILGLGVLLLAIQYKWTINCNQAAKVYRMIRFIGPWSMLDLFVISILITLVNLEVIVVIETGVGVTAFSSVVVLTMIASHTFDQRLIWNLVR